MTAPILFLAFCAVIIQLCLPKKDSNAITAAALAIAGLGAGATATILIANLIKG